jgi:O-antigen ligase
MKTMTDRKTIHHYIYFFALFVLVCTLPLSRYLRSLSILLLAANWVAEGNLKEKFTLLRQNYAIPLFASLFLIYLAGLIHTENMAAGLSRVNNALPLLSLPLIMGSSAPLNMKQLRGLMAMFVIAVTTACLICLFHYFLSGRSDTWDFRTISLFMSHIRFSFLIVMAILILLYFSSYDDYFSKRRIWLYILSLLLLLFLIFLRSMTGIILFLITIPVLTLVTTSGKHNRLIRYGFLSLFLVFFALLLSALLYMHFRFFTPPSLNPDKLDRFTTSGNQYSPPSDLSVLENGNYVGLYICEPELSREWNKVSHIPYNSSDHRGQYISNTIKRYMTSKGLRKDSAGVSKLVKEDIAAIENGSTNFYFTRASIAQRLYETLWEFHVWRLTGFVQQHSFSQRIVFLQSAMHIIRQNPITGVGIGDVYGTMLKTARDKNIGLDYKWEGKPHNEYAYIFVGTGLLGFAWFIFALLFPAIKLKLFNNLLFSLFFILIGVSMCTLDTLESYDSVVFFSFFYSLFLAGNSKKTRLPEATGL